MYTGILIKAVVFAAGFCWCREVFGRWRSDLDQLRHVEENAYRVAIIAIWILTLVVAIVTAGIAIGCIADIVHGIRLLAA